METKKFKLAILTSHPIQYQAPFFRQLAQTSGIDLKIYFCWDFGVEENFDPDFNQKIKWDIPLLDGYNYKFLKNYSWKKSSEFWGQINPSIIKELKDKPDALIIFGWNSFTNWLACLTAFSRGIPVFLRGDNPLNQEFFKSGWKIKIKKIILGWLFKKISAFLYVGEENKKYYQFYGTSDDKLFFVPHAVDNDYFVRQATKNRKDKKITIIFVGKLTGKKRPMDLLEAYEILMVAGNSLRPACRQAGLARRDERRMDRIGGADPLTSNPTLIPRALARGAGSIPQLTNSLINLTFVGDGPLRNKLEKYVKEHKLKNVVFAGFKNQTELSEYYNQADILVLPSGMGESWGLVVNEAMNFSLATVVSDMVGCASDLVKHGVNGYIFPLGDIQKLAQYLKDLIANRQKLESFGKKSVEIIKNYSYEKDVEGLLKALHASGKTNL